MISSLSYPVVLLTFMISIVFLVITFAIPKFADFYNSFDTQLPAVTKALINSGNFLQKNILFIIGGLISIYMLIKIIEKTNKHIFIFDYMKLKLPFFGKIILENAMSVFSRTLGIIISGGIPVPQATRIAVQTFSNRYLMNKLRALPDKIEEGNLLSSSLSEYKFIPDILTEIIHVGEDSGNLVDVLEKNADFFETTIDTKLNTVITMIEPALIIFLGLIVAFMLISVFLPMFNTVHIIG